MLLKTIGNEALKGTGLRTIEIPKSVFWIGDGLMADCKLLDHEDTRKYQQNTEQYVCRLHQLKKSGIA